MVGCASLQCGHSKSENSTISSALEAPPCDGPGGARLQNLAIALKRLGTKRKQRIGNQEFTVGQSEERELRRLLLGAAAIALDQNHHMAYPRRRRGQNGLNLPDPAGVVTPIRLEKIFHRLLGGRGRGKVCRVDRGKRSRRPRLAPAAGAGDWVAAGACGAGACGVPFWASAAGATPRLRLPEQKDMWLYEAAFNSSLVGWGGCESRIGTLLLIPEL